MQSEYGSLVSKICFAHISKLSKTQLVATTVPYNQTSKIISTTSHIKFIEKVLVTHTHTLLINLIIINLQWSSMSLWVNGDSGKVKKGWESEKERVGRVWGTGEEHRHIHRCEATKMIMAGKIITNNGCFFWWLLFCDHYKNKNNREQPAGPQQQETCKMTKQHFGS